MGNSILLMAKHRPSIGFFYSKTGFLPWYCQISTDLDKILNTPIAVCFCVFSLGLYLVFSFVFLSFVCVSPSFYVSLGS